MGLLGWKHLMANLWLNGSRLKKYEEPLTDEMLQWIYAAKTRKQGLAQLKQQAKDEANAWVQHAKEHRQATMLPIQSMATIDEDSNVKPFYLPLSLMTQTMMMDTHALVDSKDSISVMSS